MLEDGRFDSLGRSQSLHNACILIANVPFNHVLHCFYLIKTMVKSDYLADELGAFRHQTVVDVLIDGFKSVTESFFHVAYSMELCVMGAHHCTVIAQKLLTTVAKVAQRLIVKHTRLRLSHMLVQNRLCAEWTLIGHTHRHSVTSCGDASIREDWEGGCSVDVAHLALAHVAHGIYVGW